MTEMEARRVLELYMEATYGDNRSWLIRGAPPGLSEPRTKEGIEQELEAVLCGEFVVQLDHSWGLYFDRRHHQLIPIIGGGAK